MAADPVEKRARAPRMEVVASKQGEGAFVGEAQVFVRLRGCPLRCRWCDTPASWAAATDAAVRIASLREPREEPALATPFQAACWVAECEPGEPRTVSVTGGEPLAWPDFLLALRPLLKPRRMHLETAGAHPRALSRVLQAFDHISLDLKPEADLDPPEEWSESPAELHAPFRVPGKLGGEERERSPVSAGEWRAARTACLRLVAGRDACGKIVVQGGREAREYTHLFDEVEEFAPSLPLYLTPVTPLRGIEAASVQQLEEVVELARDRGLSVRVVPQIHRMLRIP
jgi:organic radical activating enzyme